MTTPQDPHQPGVGPYAPQPPAPQQPGSIAPGQPTPYGRPPHQEGFHPHGAHQQGAGQFPQSVAYGAAAGHFPPPPPPGSAAGPTPGSSALPKILIAVLVVLVVALGIFLFIQDRRSDPTAAVVGDCLKVEGTSSLGNPRSEQIDCTDPQALFTVTETGGSDLTCDRIELSYTRYRGDDRSDVTGKMCLRPNFEVGECYIEPVSRTTLPELGVCSSLTGSAELEVVSIDENTADSSVCQDPRLSYTYTKRNVVVCFSQVP